MFGFLLLASPQICEIVLGMTSKVIALLEVPDAINVQLVDGDVGLDVGEIQAHNVQQGRGKVIPDFQNQAVDPLKEALKKYKRYWGLYRLRHPTVQRPGYPDALT